MKDAWVWMMDYCHRNSLPPAQKWAWDKAKKAYQEAAQNTKESTAHLTTSQGQNAQSSTSAVGE